MRNNYRIDRGMAIIEIIYKDTLYETKINSRHLDKLLNIDIKWGISLSLPNQQMYVMSQIEGKTTYLHRFITNAPKGKLIDHVNHNTLDNRDTNLNIVSQNENQQNLAKASRNSKSGIIGVSWDKVNKKWRASIMVNRKMMNLGRFINVNDAVKARKDAEKVFFTYLSKITEEAV